MNRRIAVADIGGTNARFALAELDGGHVESVSDPVTLPTSDFATFGEAWREFCGRNEGREPDSIGIAFAGPIRRGPLKLTNNRWAIDPDEMAKSGISHVTIVNDFAAIAYAITELGDEHFDHLCGPEGPLPRDGRISILGPGTGLGVAAIAGPAGDRIVVDSEGGHVGFAPSDALEDRILAQLRQRLGRVAIEDVASGPGLSNLHRALAELRGEEPLDIDNRALWAQAIDGADPSPRDTLDLWCAILGGFAGDLALVHGAAATVIAGGLGYRLRHRLPRSDFAARFRAKGRVERRMIGIGVKILDHPQPGLLGAAIAFVRDKGA